MYLGSDSRRDLAIAGACMAWLGGVLWMDRSGSMIQQVLLGVVTWVLLVLLLRREAPLLRAQTAVVVIIATAVEYTFSPLLEVYTYRLGTVPAYVPPGHGLVYLAAFALGRSPLFLRYRRPLVAATVLVGGAWAVYGVTLAERSDLLGAFWFGCLLGFLAWGRSRMLYVGAFVAVSLVELAGTTWGVWAWAVRDPILGVVTQGNPPSGAPGGYGWFDLWALLLAPFVLNVWLAVSARVRATRISHTPITLIRKSAGRRALRSGGREASLAGGPAGVRARPWLRSRSRSEANNRLGGTRVHRLKG